MTQPASRQPPAVVIGVTLLWIGFLMFVFFAPAAGETATFGMNVGRAAAFIVLDLVLPVQAPTLLAFTVFLGPSETRGVRSTGWMIGVVAFAFVAAFLIWATAGKSFNLVGMLSSTLARATPIALAALCGVISERSAVVTSASRIMLMSAQAAVMVGTLTDSLCSLWRRSDGGHRGRSTPCWSSAQGGPDRQRGRHQHLWRRGDRHIAQRYR
jgi:simple sugar transport system permease protein